MIGNAFKQSLLTGRRQPGIWMSLGSSTATEIAAHSGADWLLVDMEHSPNEVASVLDQLRAAVGGCPVIVRPPVSDQVYTKRLMDIGVQTLMFPMIQNAAQAREAVAWTRYAPSGVRGISGIIRANGYGRDAGYLQRYQSDVCVIVQVETPEAIGNISEIAAVPGIDAIFIGPGDLAASMGFAHDRGAPEVRAVIGRAVADIRAAGLPAGVLGYGAESARGYFEMGVGFVAVGADTWLLARGIDRLIEECLSRSPEGAHGT